MKGDFHQENFVVVRKRFQNETGGGGGTPVPGAAEPFMTPDERAIFEEQKQEAETAEANYRALLSDANTAFFHREYTIALEKYLDLRNKILVESNPEMPSVPGTGRWIALDVAKVDGGPIFELTRRYFEQTVPQGHVQIGGKRLIQAGEFPPNAAIQPFSSLGLDAQLSPPAELTRLRQAARDLVLERKLDAAQKFYARVSESALADRDYRLAGQLMAESGAMTATYGAEPTRREALTVAAASFREAEGLFHQLGDEQAESAMRSNLANVQAELANPITDHNRPGTVATNLPPPQTDKSYLLPDDGSWKSGIAVVSAGQALRPVERHVGLFTAEGVRPVSLAPASYEPQLREAVYDPRISATTLDGIDFYEEIETNFVAYIPHLFFFDLPVAIGDTYLALGQYANALDEYESALAYSFLNVNIEVPFLWLRIAKMYLRWGDDLFRQDAATDAQAKYEQIIGTDLSIPLGSPLYQPTPLTAMRTVVAEVVKDMQGAPHAPFNSKVAEAVLQAYIQLKKLEQGLNFLGLAPDHFSIFRFKYLQSVATYMADNAIQVERAFISFRTTAENEQLERIQLESAVAVNQAALAVEEKRIEDAQLDVQAAQDGLNYTNLRKQHADASVDEWKTSGHELGTINHALTWMSFHADDADVTFTGAEYKGQAHDYSGTAADVVDTLAGRREQIDYHMHLAQLQREADEVAEEVVLAQDRVDQANVRYEIQKLNRDVAQKRLDGAQEALNFATDRTFDEDLWYKLAGELQDLSRNYLDMAIYAAFLMERAYDLEFDRNLKRIRLDYGIGSTEAGLLGGDYLKRDIASFTLDYLEQAQKPHPVRLALSLRDEFPAAFETFVQEGVLPFRTDLEIFDRRYPGTMRRAIKKVELFVEGLVPLEGVNGHLLHEGISTEWRQQNGSWVKYARVVPPERMILSSYQDRRDFMVFQVSDEVLGIFENLGVQGNWTLELPRSNNNIVYDAISDIKLVLYFDAEYNDELAQYVKTVYPNDGGRSLILSARFHFPDEYFRLDADRKVTFLLTAARFAYNQQALKVEGLGVRLLPKDNVPLANIALTLARASDNSSVAGVTGAQGAVQGDETTMAPFDLWKGASPIDSFTVQLGADLDTSKIADIQLFLDYAFTYRADGQLSA